MKNRKTIYVSIFFIILSGSIFSQNRRIDRSRFYRETNNRNSNVGVNVTLRRGIPRNIPLVRRNDDRDDSAALQQIIDHFSRRNSGARLFFPRGTYNLGDIILKSNIHITFAAGSTIIPVVPRRFRGIFAIFQLGTSTIRPVNVSIRTNGTRGSNGSSDGRFTVDISGPEVRNNHRPNDDTEIGFAQFVLVRNASNFLISGCNILDFYSIQSSLNFNTVESPNGTVRFASNGIVENITSFDGGVGYGLIQVRIAKNILFNNLDGEGGVTLRLESGSEQVIRQHRNNRNVNMDNIYGRNIICRDGNAAVMLHPHTVRNGFVDIDDIESIGAGVALRLTAGYQQEFGIADNNNGRFASNSIITDIKARFGINAQSKHGRTRYVPCGSRIRIARNLSIDEESYKSPSLAAVTDEARPDADRRNVPFGTPGSPNGAVPYRVNYDAPANIIQTGRFPAGNSNARKVLTYSERIFTQFGANFPLCRGESQPARGQRVDPRNELRIKLREERNASNKAVTERISSLEESAKDIFILQNLTNNTIRIESSSNFDFKGGIVTIFNLSGQVMLTKDIESDNVISINSLAKGMYIAKIGSFTQKIVVQ